MTALEKLNIANNSGKFICVGLDTDINKIPKYLLNIENPILEFNKIIIEKTKDVSAAYKINFAFYETMGAKGFEILKSTIELIPNNILIIGDAKRGDIGNTSEMYAKSLFEYFNCDASTLHPYMGYDSISPFLEYNNKLNFILTLTSNKSSEDFEKQKLENGGYLFQYIIKKVKEWNVNNNCGFVFGATNINELEENIEIIKNNPILLPGIGAQGGSLQEVVKILFNHNVKNFIINSSRGIIFKDNSEKFGEAAKEEIIKMNLLISQLRQP